MCISCGCGKPDERHKEGDIVMADLRRAAQNANIDIEQAADNIHNAAKQARDQGQG
ncbi:MAG: hypothetical protein M3336_02995 [Chloroflexota bacterium]|nr:hypothetical protein [Chloroflexota bacterium]